MGSPFYCFDPPGTQGGRPAVFPEIPGRTFFSAEADACQGSALGGETGQNELYLLLVKKL